MHHIFPFQNAGTTRPMSHRPGCGHQPWEDGSQALGRLPGRRACRRPRWSRLGVESLESRQLLAAHVIINEIHYDPDIKTELVEFIELHNAGDQAADLSRWQLADAVQYEFPAGTTLAAGGYLVVSESPEALTAKFQTSSHGPYEGRLNADGEIIQLLDAAGTVVDQVRYQLGFPWPVVGEAPGYSMELIHPSLDNSLGGSWRPSVGSQEIFGDGQTWTYFKGLREPTDGTPAWRQQAFDDSAWQFGVGPVGFSSRIPMGTNLADMRKAYTSVYLRQSFQIADPAAVGGLTLQALYDDGMNVWINGVHVARTNAFDAELPFNAVANSSLNNSDYVDVVLPDPTSYLVAGENVIAVQLLNQDISNSDAYFDARLLNTSNRPPGPSPGRINSIYATQAAPQMHEVEHSPQQPESGEAVTVTAHVTDPDGVANVTLDYQLVNPGDYIARA